MTILPAVISTAQLVSGLVSGARNARDLAKESSDHALKAAVSDLYDAVLDVKARVLDLDEENRRLKAELQRSEEIIGPIEPHGYFFLKDRTDQPLCPKCLQSQPRNVVFLGPLKPHNSGKLRRCPVCGFSRYEERPSRSGASFAIVNPSLPSRLRGF